MSRLRALPLSLGAALAAATLAAPVRAAAQAGHAHHAPAAAPTAAARAQLAAARKAVAPLATPEAAVAAGYRPMFGNVPLQGEHYVRVDLVLSGAFELERPSVLMFAPVRGTPTLVGAAYAFMHPDGTPPPPAFDGAADAWHTHDRLVRTRGRGLLMMHVWFVDAPEGPFARYNPWLPYLATGLTPPPAATFADSAAGDRARRLGFALATSATPPVLFDFLTRQAADSVRARITTHRARLDSLVPRLAAAERAGDRAARERLAADAIRASEALAEAYRDAAPPNQPIARRLVDRTVDEFMGRGHGIEEELGALFNRGRPNRP